MNFYFLLSALCDEDREFVERLYERYGDYMYATAYGILKHRQDAEDAVNDAMCKIIKYLSKFDKSANEKVCNMVVICIRSIVKNKAIDNYNKNKKRAEHYADYYVKSDDGSFTERDFVDESFSTEDIVIRHEERETVQKALTELTQDMQDAINLVYMCGYSTVEAADFLGISENAVRARLFKARNKLKKILEKEFGANAEE